ncbi:MAG: DUF2383 domain-containing protein [Salinimicrobium sediminis]|uniref:DUF2383 domain-containing protein n=1 Tax=Salinimicrobium sediminis TaxID=1343891 RepID=A0A285X685_9FLAO|nr:DUF2383 domain-containing protein [Salinimicrobium sediminis]MDX1601741.1 DUF2383 domain-containing protein [Salinimicrobium sediminis]SOC80857.1 protein of unknown function [Salinimicrobium sediminis]
MNHSKIRERSLRQLLEDNFKVARHCRKIAEHVIDASLKYYFQNIASRRSQFAMEIAEEISYYGGKEPYMSSSSYDRNRMETGIDDQAAAIKKALKIHKESLQSYQDALCRIHEGSCREILLRHKAFIENAIFELKSIKTLLKYVPTNTRNSSKERAI